MPNLTTTPFPTAEKTEDRFFCRTCAITDHADILVDEITCAWCDSTDVIDEQARNAELVRERAAFDLEGDRMAEERCATQAEGFLRRRQAS